MCSLVDLELADNAVQLQIGGGGLLETEKDKMNEYFA